jgi:hypothetical protein
MMERPAAEFLSSLFEYRATFEPPVFAVFERPTVIAEALYGAFREWNLALENISIRSVPMTANDLQVACDLLNKKVTFTISVGSATLQVTNPNWSEVSQMQSILRQGLLAVAVGTGASLKEQLATLTMHAKGPGKSAKELTSRFRPNVAGPFQNEERGFGFCSYGQEGSWLVDLSALYNEAIFVRINRVFGPSISFEEIATVLYKDESEIFDVLELKVE